MWNWMYELLVYVSITIYWWQLHNALMFHCVFLSWLDVPKITWNQSTGLITCGYIYIYIYIIPHFQQALTWIWIHKQLEYVLVMMYTWQIDNLLVFYWVFISWLDEPQIIYRKDEGIHAGIWLCPFNKRWHGFECINIYYVYQQKYMCDS